MAKGKIKCPVCGGNAVLTKYDMPLFGGKIILRDETHYVCSKCKKAFSTSAQVRAAEKKLREHFFFERTIISTGRSLAITLPPDFAKFYHLRRGEKVSIMPEGPHEARLTFE